MAHDPLADVARLRVGLSPPITRPRNSAGTPNPFRQFFRQLEREQAKRHRERERRKDKNRRRRERIFKRDAYRCVSCGSTEDLTLDHIIPVSKGGRGTQDNLQTMCEPCNRRKADRLPEDLAA